MTNVPLPLYGLSRLHEITQYTSRLMKQKGSSSRMSWCRLCICFFRANWRGWKSGKSPSGMWTKPWSNPILHMSVGEVGITCGWKCLFFNEHVGGRCSGYVNLFHPFHGTGSQNYPGPILHIYIYRIFGEAFPVSCFQRGLAWLTKLPFVVCRVFVSIFQQALHHL